MKNIKKYILAGLLSVFALTAAAQFGWDLFAPVRVVPLTQPLNLKPGSNATTNGPYDIRKYTGIANIVLNVATNTGTAGGTLTCQLYGSMDTTNLYAISNLAYIPTLTAFTYTNTYYGGNPNAITNTVSELLPGTSQNVTLGGVTPYLNYFPFTNSAALTVSNGVFEIGLPTDTYSYVYVVWIPGGTVTNFTVSAAMTANLKTR